MTAVGILYPGYSAEDDYPLLRRRLGDDYRLPLVSVVATYPAEVAALSAQSLVDAGLPVTATSARGIITAAEVDTFDESTVLGAAASGARDGVEAVLLPDTVLHTVAVLDELEASAGVAVLTANQVSTWYEQRLAGDRTRHDGSGSLFRCATEPL